MAYSEELERRLDEVVIGDGITKKHMFGGLSYLVNGNMSVGIVKDEMIVRTSPENEPELLKIKGVRPMDFTGRPMKGWLSAAPESFDTPEKLKVLVDAGVGFARSLPPKNKSAKSHT